MLKTRIGKEKDIYCSGLFLSARWFVLSTETPDNINLVILPDRESAEYCCSDLYQLVEGDCVFFLPSGGKGIERSNYKSSLSVQRTAAIGSILKGEKKKVFIVSYPEALEEKIPSGKKVSESLIRIRQGQEIPFNEIIGKLISEGFEKTDFVSAPGQYSVRGSLIDIFSYSNNEPYRVSFWGNEIDGISVFDCNTQISKEKTEEAEIIGKLVSEDNEEGDSIFSILPENTVIWLDSSDLYKEKDFFPSTGKFHRVFLDTPLGIKTDSPEVFNITPQPSFNKNFTLLKEDINNKIENGYRVYIYGEKASQLNRIKSILISEGGMLPEFVEGKNIHSGFIDEDSKTACYSDHEIFNRFHRVNIRRSVEKSEQLTINDLNSFNIGDYVVHIDYGVGVFGGLVKMYDEKGRAKEVVKINYRDGDVVFVSVHALNKLSLYRSSEGEAPKVNKLGSKTWVTLKANAKRTVKNIAKDLIRLYAKRRATRGFSYSADTYLQDELESSFMFEDTPDQEMATIAVKRDMEDNCPMDRLVCGDVGFGKTEIVIRAAFKAAADGKQVAVLVPTTILALQHYNTFTSRLANFPCTVDYVSRLRTTSQINDIKNKLSNGKIDILIGTHKILGNGFEFKDLGLLIIDEEQKFGVAAKEKLRQMKSNVDTLTLTATPIPRTLQFSLLGARDLSIINTPPPNRIPVQTEIILFDEKEIKSIVNYELNRGGQIFFLHNKVEELPHIEKILARLVPDARICVAHGQMGSKELEDRMLGFIRGDYDILLCTTIIENGLDIPNANTIIINQAQNIGLSDLHQLRGRVGRSNRKAFCYLIVPPLASVTEEARRRLRAIEEFSDLGSGFNIAMQDLDIRGAGNLLGAEQSGFIMDMGYETFQKVINEAMDELGIETGQHLRRGNEKYISDCTIETDQEALIPDDYIDIPAEKIRIYKQLDSMDSEKELDRLSIHITDRFGKIPEALQNLFNVVKIRNLGMMLGFEKIIVKNGMCICFFIQEENNPYYKSKTFENILAVVSGGQSPFVLKQADGKLKLVAHGLNGLGGALVQLNKFR
jgi:transcription-repair coupling factor (superfamily II helicase)